MIERRVACRGEEGIAITQRHGEDFSEEDDHLSAGLRPAGFDKTNMTRGNPGLLGEGQLAYPPLGTPLAQQSPKRTLPPVRSFGSGLLGLVHRRILRCLPPERHYLRGN